jgi:hypothetical protein
VLTANAAAQETPAAVIEDSVSHEVASEQQSIETASTAGKRWRRSSRTVPDASPETDDAAVDDAVPWIMLAETPPLAMRKHLLRRLCRQDLIDLLASLFWSRND